MNEEKPDQPQSAPVLDNPWTLSAGDLVSELNVDPDRGLESSEVKVRKRHYGPNALEEAESRSIQQILYQQCKSVVVAILAIAAVLSFILGDLPEAFAIVGVIVINTGIGFVSEWRATRSMEALRKIGRPTARLLRDGDIKKVQTDTIVPGDIVLLEAGDVVPADVRLLKANSLGVDQSALTGESVATTKDTDPLEIDTPLADRNNIAYRGTSITDGEGVGVVFATGMHTELGRISQLVEGVEDEHTPLEKQLHKLGRRMAILVICSAALFAVGGLLVGKPTELIIVTAVALGVAAIPEGLPIVANLALARGMWLMAKRKALINRLHAVETLGATNVIFTDKTGTLTENRMTLRKVLTPGGETEFEDDAQNFNREMDRLTKRVLEIGVLCSNASLGDDEDQQPHGDPTEVALLRAGDRGGMDRKTLLQQKREVREESFDPDVLMMGTFHETDEGYDVAVKGAPAAVIEACNRIAGEHEDQPFDQEKRDQWLEKNRKLAADGLRLLAVADKRADDPQEDPYENLRFIGLVGLYDPPSEGVKGLIESCHHAGISVVMVTGDQPETARAIAYQTGIVDAPDARVIHGSDLPKAEDTSEQQRKEILETRVFARLAPEQKLDLVQVYRDAKNTVAMTGDGINDAPALKQADIGIAMGQRGTDAAREASDMVLKDDSFASIVAAVHQGRVIFSNIRKSVMFMLCTNVAEVLAVAAALTGLPLPLFPLQILYLNMLTDVFPALALGVGKGSTGVMDRDPRPVDEAVLTRSHWGAIGGYGVVIAACVIGGLVSGTQLIGLEADQAVTISFLTIGFAKLWFVFNLRESDSNWLRNSITRNPWIWAAISTCVILLIAAVYLPGLSVLLKTYTLGLGGWLTLLGLSLVPLAIGQIHIVWKNR